MNALLKELSARSWVQPTYIDGRGAVCEYSQDEWPRYWSEEKFAKLILDECAEFLMDDGAVEAVTYRLMKHFGVE